MSREYIENGCIQLARRIQVSEIWQDKPSWWLKVWIHLLLGVNHTDRGKFKRGQGFFTRKGIYKDCGLVVEGIEPETIDNVLRWLKSTTRITTQKTTRGMVITVSNYERYQQLLNYKNDTKNDIETTQKRHYTQECNNGNNVVVVHNFPLNKAFYEKLRSTFKDVDVNREIEKAALWCEANPGRGSKKNIERFLLNWLNRGETYQAKQERRNCQIGTYRAPQG